MFTGWLLSGYIKDIALFRNPVLFFLGIRRVCLKNSLTCEISITAFGCSRLHTDSLLCIIKKERIGDSHHQYERNGVKLW